MMFAPKALTSKNLWLAFDVIRKDLKKLERIGFDVKHNNETVKVYVRLLAVSGDNMALNYVYGLTGSFSNGMICRFCLATADFIKQFVYFHEKRKTQIARAGFGKEAPKSRSKIKYEVSKLIGVKRMHPFYSRYCPLITDINQIQSVDIFHDILQGVLGY